MLKPMYIYKVTQDSFFEEEFGAEVGFYMDEKDAIKAARNRAKFLASNLNPHNFQQGELDILDELETNGCISVYCKCDIPGIDIDDDRYKIYVTCVEVH